MILKALALIGMTTGMGVFSWNTAILVMAPTYYDCRKSTEVYKVSKDVEVCDAEIECPQTPPTELCERRTATSGSSSYVYCNCFQIPEGSDPLPNDQSECYGYRYHSGGLTIRLCTPSACTSPTPTCDWEDPNADKSKCICK